MKILITTGHPHSGYETVQQILHAAGQAEAMPSRREGMSVAELHSNIFKASEHQSSAIDAQAPIEPGKVWQEVGVDLFLGNLSHKLWGWADPRSTWLLDFWKSFDNQTRFILVYSSPEAAVGRMLENQDTPLNDIESAIASWLAYNSEILRFYHRNRERCLLVNAAAAALAPENLIKKASLEFGLRTLPAGFSVSSVEFGAITACLTKFLLDDYPEASALYQELESAAELDLFQSIGESVTKQQAWQEYIQLRRNLKNLQHMQRQMTEQLDELSAARNAQEKRYKDAVQENELLLLQIHEVQNELERNLLKQSELSKACDEQIKLAAERLTALEQMTRAREQQIKTTEERTLQIEKVCQERNRHAKLAAEYQKALEHMTAAREQQTKITEERTKQIEKVCQERDRQAQLAAERLQHIEELNQLLAGQFKTAAQQDEVEHLIAYARFWRHHQPAEVLVDLRHEIDGENWYYAEADGRWAGPADTSVIRIPSLRDGLYSLQLEVVDAMAPDIAEGTTVSLNGVPLQINVSGDSYPLLLHAHFSTEGIPESLIWQFALKYPRLASPADNGSKDTRSLAIRLGTLKLACAE